MGSPLLRGGSIPGASPEGENLVQAVAGGSTLAKSPALRKLLLYLWAHRHEETSEYAIALDVFAKRSDFDPKLDATVRVQVSRLRQKLREHFDSDPATHPFRLVIPQRSHRLEMQPAPADPGAWARLRAIRPWLAPALIAALSFLCGVLAYRNSRLDTEVATLRENGELPELWQTLLRPGRLTRVVYPIPVFYNWGALRVRDVSINDPEGWRKSALLLPFVQKLGTPQLSQSYSVASDTSAAIEITRFLSGRGVALEVSPTANLSLDQYGKENLVFLGIPPTNAALDRYGHRTNFALANGGGAVENRRPKPGEPAMFVSRAASDAGALHQRHGMIAVLPGHSSDTSLILLMGPHTASLATFLTSPPSLEQFGLVWQKAGKPPFFEAVVEAEIERGQVKSARCAAFRAISVSN